MTVPPRSAALAAILITLGCMAQGATLTVLHAFSTGSVKNDGANPYGGLALAGGTLFGTTQNGGAYGFGTIFRVNPDGSGYAKVYDFTGAADGGAPQGKLILGGNMLYGSASAGGASNYGTIFAIDTNAWRLTPLYNFTNGLDGAAPSTGVVLANDLLYGTSGTYPSTNLGALFELATNGSNFTVLHHFSHLTGTANLDGAYPYGLQFYNGVLYGAASDGGTNGTGTLFGLPAGQTNFSLQESFPMAAYPFVNSNGAYPGGGVVVAGGTLFGVASYGGSSGWGTVYAGATSGGGIASLHSFSAGTDYRSPNGTPTVLGSNLYGVTPATIFMVGTNGLGFANLQVFQGVRTNNGSGLNGDFAVAGHVLYGTAYSGGVGGAGTVFALDLLPAIPLGIQQVAGSIVLTWTNAQFVLQSAPSVAGPYVTAPGAQSPYTNPPSAGPVFFRLEGN